ncbi:MAG: RNA polymerase sigma factor [Flavitalea sp.]
MKEAAQQPEIDWLVRLKQHDEKALALLMQEYYSAIYNYAFKFSKDTALVADCIQEVFISLWQRRETATTILSIKYYLLRAVKNKILKALHSNRRKAEHENTQHGYEFLQEFSIEKQIIENQISEEKAERLKHALAFLSKKQQEIIYLKYYQHLDYGQIADLMSINRQSVYNLLHETIQKLRNVWHIEFVT